MSRSSREVSRTTDTFDEVLRQALPGMVSTRASDRLAYAHDASHYLLEPQAVITPSDADQVAKLLQVSAEHGLSVTFRSGGTSLSGQASSDGLLVDTRRNFGAIEILDNGQRVRVQPGVTIRSVNARLARHHRKLGPDPASESACTIGGVIANNSSGMVCGTEWNTYRTLESAVLILADGTVIDTAATDADDQLKALRPEVHQGLDRLRRRVLDNSDSVATIRRLFAIKNTMGYGINAFLDHSRPIDILTHLVIGSEGTLAFVAEATFRTMPVHPYAATGLIIFDDLATATASLPTLVDSGLAAIELLDPTSLRVAQRDPQAIAELRSLQVVDHTALLLEHQQPSSGELAQHVTATQSRLDQLRLTSPAAMTSDTANRAALWHIRKGLYAAVAGARPSGTTALLEDIAVPVDELLPACSELAELFQRHGYADSVIFGHAKDGNLHFLLNEHFGHADETDRYLRFTEDMVDLVLNHGGTLKAEHGTGRIMAPYLRRQYGDELHSVMQEIKLLLDPRGTLNPGVLLADDPTGHISNLKTTPMVESEVDRCVECGYCEPVCPSKDLTTTPRRRIVLRREIARATEAGDQELAEELRRDYTYDGVETCAVDGMCQTACPVQINTGDLVRRLRTEQSTYTEQRFWRSAAEHWDGVTRSAAVGLRIASAAPDFLPVTGTRAARAVFGKDRIPAWAPDLPSGGTRRRPVRTQSPAAVFFPSCMCTMFGPAGSGSGDAGMGATEAVLALSERAGVELRVPDQIASLCCGMPWKSKGLTYGHEVMGARVVPVLRTATENGKLPLIVDAASCTQGLAELLQDNDIEVIDATVFVEQSVLPRLPQPRRMPSLVLHPTCASTQLGIDDTLRRLAAAIADEVVVPDAWGCCGFAGDRGMLHPELTASATAAEAAEVAQYQGPQFASANRACEIGMSRATGHPYRHLLELLEEATRQLPTIATDEGP